MRIPSCVGFMKLVAIAVLAASSGCAGPVDASDSASTDESTRSIEQAIVHGESDDGDPAVVALLSGGKVFCTGVLLTANVVATAAHCVSPTPPDQIYFGKDPSSKKGTFIDVSGTSVHPDFDEDTLENDIGVVGLAATAPVAPLDVFKSDLDASDIGRPIRLVGFGATKPDDNIESLRKRTGPTKIKSFGDDDFRFEPGPSQTCVGDSGGPALAMYGDHEAVIGITSSGDGDCKVYGRDMRIDRFIPFIHGFAKAYSIRVASTPSPTADRGCSTASRAPTRGFRAASLVVLAAFVVAGTRRARRRRGVTRS